MEYNRLPLKGTVNTRELGGYPTNDGRVTKYHVFLRSDGLTNLTQKDNMFLKEYGITDIIDLRGSTAIQDSFISDDNIDKEYFKFHYIPLSNKKIEEYVKENQYSDDFNFGIGYSYLLDNKDKIKEIFEILAKSKGGVLFHCAAGKDRTGVVSALILGLCNVSIQDIIANYEITSTYICKSKFMEIYSRNMQRSDSLFMSTFIDILLEKYGSFEEYLLSCNISKENLDKVKNKLCI